MMRSNEERQEIYAEQLGVTPNELTEEQKQKALVKVAPLADGNYIIRLKSNAVTFCEVYGGKLYCPRVRDVDYGDIRRVEPISIGFTTEPCPDVESSPEEERANIPWPVACSHCEGRGSYIGLNTRSECTACGGSGLQNPSKP